MNMGHPILGDNIYAPSDVRAMAERLMLHAQFLRLTHPETGEAIEFQSPLSW